MSKVLSALILAAFAVGAQAASHGGAAPMKAEAAKPAASAADAKKMDAKADAKKEMKKEEKKTDVKK